MDLVDQAIALAIEAHNGQYNNHNGEVYLLHVQRVANSVRDAGYGPKFVAAAWLHDAVEDTNLSLANIQGTIREPEVVSAVIALTHERNEPYKDYVQRLCHDRIARVVKLNDLHDNFRRNHLIQDEATRLRMAKKYSEALDILTSVGVL